MTIQRSPQSRRLRYILTMVSAGLISMALCACQSAITRDYTVRGQLTAEQEQIVIELARRRGITRIHSITTYEEHPSYDIGITVTETETVDGRSVRKRLLRMWNAKWLETPREVGETDIVLGDFCALTPFETRSTILKVRGKEYRCEIKDVPVEVCERMIEKLVDGKFTLGESVTASSLNNVDFERPTWISRDGANGFFVGFDDKYSQFDWYRLDIKHVGDGLEIIKVVHEAA